MVQSLIIVEPHSKKAKSCQKPLLFNLHLGKLKCPKLALALHRSSITIIIIIFSLIIIIRFIIVIVIIIIQSLLLLLQMSMLL